MDATLRPILNKLTGKPWISLSTLKGIKVTIFTAHIVFLQDAPNGSIIHLSTGELLDTRLTVKEVLDMFES